MGFMENFKFGPEDKKPDLELTQRGESIDEKLTAFEDELGLLRIDGIVTPAFIKGFIDSLEMINDKDSTSAEEKRAEKEFLLNQYIGSVQQIKAEWEETHGKAKAA